MKKIHSQNSGRESEASILGNDREREFPLTPVLASSMLALRSRLNLNKFQGNQINYSRRCQYQHRCQKPSQGKRPSRNVGYYSSEAMMGQFVLHRSCLTFKNLVLCVCTFTVLSTPNCVTHLWEKLCYTPWEDLRLNFGQILFWTNIAM